MTIRVPVSTIFNNWHDAQTVDVDDVDVEQTRNVQTDAAIINNHFGSGVLPSSIIQNVIFDSDNLNQTQASILAAGNFDGTGMQAHAQPSDTNLGNQLEVELSGTNAFGRFSTKVLVIGLDFQSTPQYDRFVFYRDEKQVTKKHYTRILGIFFNDFKGNNNCSRDLGGTIVIRETASFQLSRDPIMVAQDVEPNLFFRDFKVPNSAVTLYNTIQTGIGPEYSVDSLDINTTVLVNQPLLPGDVTSKIGQKFLAATNNIQKITLLLGAEEDASAAEQNKFDWAGNLLVSVWELQTTVSCPTDIVPELAIDFDPSSQPLAQLSFSQADLRSLGYVLTNVLQPVDFVFNNTQLGSTTNSLIVPGRYYAVTISRAGAANTGTIFTGIGGDKTEDSRLTLFSGVWVDVPEQDMWFQVWTDAAKVADGQAYDAGNGMEIEKTTENDVGAQIDYSLGSLPLADSGENILNIAVAQAIQQESVQEQDERTGSPVFSRQQFVPEISFVTPSGLSDLKEVSEPILIGCAEDINPKANSLLEKTQLFPGLAKGDVFTVVFPDPDLLSVNLIGSKLIPNTLSCNNEYRIFKVVTCTDGYGDVNGDGYIDALDIARATELVGESLSLSTTQQKIVDGYISTLELLRADVDGDGYISSNDVLLITEYVSRVINSFPVGSSFLHVDITVQESIGRFDGYFDCDGYVRLSDGYTSTDPSALNPYDLVYFGNLITPSINGSDSTFSTVPFPGVTYKIVPQPFWQDYMVVFSSNARTVPASFTSDQSITRVSCEPATRLNCVNSIDIVPECDPGRNDIMFPDNIIIKSGEILRPNGDHYKVDFEIGQIILQLPAIPLEESSINIFDAFVADNGDGFTKKSFPAMRFASCKTVKPDALVRNQIRFDVAIQAFNFNLDGYDDDGYGVIVNEGIGVLVDQSNGIMTITINDLSVNPIFRTRISKIQITVYLKEGGFNNNTVTVLPDQITGLIS
jgi:hypothetical protein